MILHTLFPLRHQSSMSSKKINFKLLICHPLPTPCFHRHPPLTQQSTLPRQATTHQSGNHIAQENLSFMQTTRKVPVVIRGTPQEEIYGISLHASTGAAFSSASRDADGAPKVLTSSASARGANFRRPALLASRMNHISRTQ